MVAITLKNPTLALAFGRALERLPTALNVVLIVALAFMAARLTWRAVPQPEPEVAPVARPVIDRPTAATHGPDIASLHLFGEASKDMPPPIMQVEVPETPLQLNLLGVFASKDPRNAWAIIAEPSGGEKTYTVNGMLPAGAILQEIHPDHVVLLRNNRMETLRLPQAVLGGPETSSLAVRGDVNSPSSSGPRGNVSLSPQASDTLRNYRQSLMTDPQSVMDVVRAEPYRQGGQLMGYRIFPGRDKEILRQIGLRPGDVVTAINGIALDNPIKGLEVMKDLPNASQVSVDVLRNGMAQTFVVPIP